MTKVKARIKHNTCFGFFFLPFLLEVHDSNFENSVEMCPGMPKAQSPKQKVRLGVGSALCSEAPCSWSAALVCEDSGVCNVCLPQCTAQT